jgi:hypothetical protein
VQLQHNEPATRILFAELKPGDRVEVIHEIKVGSKVWTTRTVGTVVRTERRRHGLHFRRAGDDKVWSDIIILKRDDGEETTITVDEFTDLRRM